MTDPWLILGPNKMDTITDLGGVVLVIIGVTEAIKRAGMSSRWAPIVALLIGVGFSFLIWGVSGGSVISGIVAGLTACGLYGGTKKTIKG